MKYTGIDVTEIISRRTDDKRQWVLLYSAIIVTVVGVIWQYINYSSTIGAYVLGAGIILFVLYSRYAKYKPLMKKEFHHFQGELELTDTGAILRDLDAGREYYFYRGNAVVKISKECNYLGMRSPAIDVEMIDFEFKYSEVAEYFRNWGLQYV